MKMAACLFNYWWWGFSLTNTDAVHIFTFINRLWKPKPLMFYLFKKDFILWFLLSQKSAQMNGWCRCYIELTVTTLAHIIRLRPFVKQVTRSTRAGRLLGGPVNTKHWGLKWERFRIRNGTSLLTQRELVDILTNFHDQTQCCFLFFIIFCIHWVKLLKCSLNIFVIIYKV